MENAQSERRTDAGGRRYSSTREMVLRMVEAQTDPVSTAALTEATGLHENTVRGHLDQLLADGHLHRELAPAAGRGRPAWLWRAAHRDAQNPYAALAGALAESLVRTSSDPVGQAREAGQVWAQQITAARRAEHLTRADDAHDEVVDVMREQGFAPVRSDDDDDVVLLRRCPLIEAATKHPEIVCAVHQGMIDGILRSRGVKADSRLVPFSSPGECTLNLRVAS